MKRATAINQSQCRQAGGGGGALGVGFCCRGRRWRRSLGHGCCASGAGLWGTYTSTRNQRARPGRPFSCGGTPPSRCVCRRTGQCAQPRSAGSAGTARHRAARSGVGGGPPRRRPDRPPGGPGRHGGVSQLDPGEDLGGPPRRRARVHLRGQEVATRRPCVTTTRRRRCCSRSASRPWSTAIRGWRSSAPGRPPATGSRSPVNWVGPWPSPEWSWCRGSPWASTGRPMKGALSAHRPGAERGSPPARRSPWRWPGAWPSPISAPRRLCGAGWPGHGAVVFEALLGVADLSWRFPQRNRIIAALAQVVIVVECHVQRRLAAHPRARRRRPSGDHGGCRTGGRSAALPPPDQQPVGRRLHGHPRLRRACWWLSAWPPLGPGLAPVTPAAEFFPPMPIPMSGRCWRRSAGSAAHSRR